MQGRRTTVAKHTGLELLFANNPLPMWVYDPKTLRFLEVNEAAVAQYGYSREEFLKMRIADIRPAEDVPRLLKDLAQTRPRLQDSGEWRHRRKDGHIVDVHIVSHTLSFAGREAVLICAQDITERKRTEEETRRLAAIVSFSEDAILSETLDGIILSWNSGAERIYGYRAKEVVGRSIALLVPRDHPNEIPEILRRLKHGEHIEHYETVRVRKDGTPIDVSLSLSPVRDAAGTIVAASTIARDITERKRTLRALQQNEARVSAIIRGALDCIITLDHTGRITEFNPAAEATFGYRRDEVLGREMAGLIIPPSLRDRHRQGLARYLATGEGPILGKRIELPAVRADGREFPVELTVSKDPSSDPPTFIGFVRDITERRRVEDERGQLLKRERQARAETEQAKQRLLLLAEASKHLAGSLDYQTTLANVARLAVPDLADWCVVDALHTDGTIRRVSVAHVDPSKIDMALELERRYPSDPHAATGVPNVLRTGKSELYPDIPDAMLAESAQDPEHLRILRALGLTSAMVVPLAGRKQVLGAITFAAAKPGRHYTVTDLEMAEELARRCALAIENSLLYKEAQGLNAELEEREARLQSLFDGVPVALFRATLEGKILEANRAFIEMLGYPDHDTLLRTNARSLYVDHEARNRWIALLERDDAAAARETALRRFDGSVIVVRSSARGSRYSRSDHAL